ncbi:LPXTG cell wall anchor domain-containing protein [Streptomyces sp. Tu 6176]|uniref:LPXTG cell wall anchor domain-containing protein n=1 Tax=Streptomyces sp. Tu 6176 TaxID=1470557 RepID=UPI002D21EC2F|nr:LPXTG cell wall anchor domain-containing protein [Streptomyces sp. Tu 6176]
MGHDHHQHLLTRSLTAERGWAGSRRRWRSHPGRRRRGLRADRAHGLDDGPAQRHRPHRPQTGSSTTTWAPLLIAALAAGVLAVVASGRE